jgi:hypothetical protein
MKISPRIGYTIIFATILLLNIALVPVSATGNESKVENNISDIPQFENWVKPMNLSEYDGNKTQIKIEPLSPEALEKTNPYIIALNKSEKRELNSISGEKGRFDITFEPDGMISAKLPLEEAETTKPDTYPDAMSTAAVFVLAGIIVFLGFRLSG